MKTLLARASLIVLMTMPAWGVGTVNQSLAQIPGSTNYVFTENWVGDSITGSVPATTMLGTGAIQGYRIVSVEIAPGSPVPTNNYAVTVTDFSGADVLSGSGVNLSNTAASILPSLSTAPPLYGSLTVNVTANVVASAQGRVLIYFAPVSQVMGNVPAGASLTSNNLFSGNNTFSGTSTFTGIVAGNPQVTQTPAIYGATCTVAALQTSLANASVTGGIVDYTACTTWSTQITNGTSTVNIPAGVTLKLGPAGPTCSITTAALPCWALTGDNAKLLGNGDSNEDAIITGQVGPRTILLGSGLGSTTDMIDVRCTGCGAFAGIEIGNLTIQMNSSRTGTNGQHGISTTSLDGGNIHDVDVYYANGGDCFHFDSGTSAAAFYRVSFDRLLARVCGNSTSPVGSGFHFLTPIGSGEMRFLTARSLIYQGYDFNNQTTPYGKAGFYFEIPAASTIAQNIGEFHCDSCRSEGSVSAAANGGVVINQQGNGFIHELYFNGLLEDNFQANLGTGFNILNNNPANVGALHIDITTANYAATHNISTTNATAGMFEITTRDGGNASRLINNVTFSKSTTGALGAASAIPNNGLSIIAPGGGASSHWYVSAGGEWIQERTDGSIIPLWDFDAGNNRIRPMVDNATDFGLINNTNWKSVNTYRHNIQEGSAPAGTANIDTCYGDSTAHTIKCSYNNGTFQAIPQAAQNGLVFDAIYGTYRVTTDQTITAGASLTNIPGLTWTFPANTALNVKFSCDLLYSQATAAASDSFGFQDVTVAPTNAEAYSRADTSATAFTAGNTDAAGVTTAVTVVTYTPSAAATVFGAHIDGLIEQPSNASTSVFNIMAQFTTNNGTIKRGSSCQVF